MRTLLPCLLATALTLGTASALAQQSHPRIMLLDAQSLANQGREVEAMVLLDQVVMAQDLSDELKAIAYAKRGNIHFRKKRYPLARDDFDRALGYDPTSEQALRGSCFTLLQMRKFDSARRICEDAATETRNESESAAEDILGYSALMRRDYLTAHRHLDRSIALDPSYAPAYLHRGLVYQAQKNDVLARADYLRARELWPQDREIEATLRQLGLIF